MQEAIRHGGRAGGRPTRAQIEPAARELVQRHGAQILSTARRYSLTAEDAEDAYQRGLEILLVKAPSTREDDLVPWLKTVVKHEAFAIRRQRRRAELSGDRDLSGGLAPPTDEQAERHERLRLGAEAMSRLKPQEVRCLLLRAEGYSYKQICEETGWTYTKVNRCLAEGRRSFLERVAGIESGAECERLAPLLFALADGQAGSGDVAALRRHLRSCLACRAALREHRAAGARVAALAPLLVAPGALLRRVAAWVHHAADAAGAPKLAAAAAATAALAGGGVATIRSLEHHPQGKHPRPAAQHHRTPIAHIAARHVHVRAAAHRRAPAARPAPAPTQPRLVRRPAASAPAPAAPQPSAAPPPEPAVESEFGP